MHSIARQLRNVLNTNFFLLHTKFLTTSQATYLHNLVSLHSPLAAPVHLSTHFPDQNHEMHEIWSVDYQENY